MVDMQVGRTYQNRDLHQIKIIFKLDENETGVDHDYPFIGYNQTTYDWISYSNSGYYNRFEESDGDLVKQLD